MMRNCHDGNNQQQLSAKSLIMVKAAILTMMTNLKAKVGRPFKDKRQKQDTEVPNDEKRQKKSKGMSKRLI